MIIAFQSLFFVNWCYQFLREMRATIRKKLPNIYLNLFLCQRKDRLQKELELVA
jgi:hypothetical protein